MGHHINSIGYRAGISYLWRFLVISSRNYEYFQNFGLVFFFFFKYVAFFFTFKYKVLFHGKGFAYSHFYVFNSVRGFVLHVYLYDKYFAKFMRRLDGLIMGHAENYYMKNQQLLYYQQKEKDDNYYRVSKLRYVGKELKRKIYKRFYVQHYSNKVKIGVDSLFAFMQKYVLKNLKNAKSFGLYLNKYGVFFRNMVGGFFKGHIYRYGFLKHLVFYVYFLYKTFNFNILLAKCGYFEKTNKKYIRLTGLNNWKFVSLYNFLLKRAHRRIAIFNKYGLFRKIILESSDALFWYRRMFQIMVLYGRIKGRRFIMREGLYRLGTKDDLMYRNVFGVKMLGSGLSSKALIKMRRKQWVLFCGGVDELLGDKVLNLYNKRLIRSNKIKKRIVIRKKFEGGIFVRPKNYSVTHFHRKSSRLKRNLIGGRKFNVFLLVKRLKYLFRNFYRERLIRFSRYLTYRVDKKFMDQVNSAVSNFNNNILIRRQRQKSKTTYRYNTNKYKKGFNRHRDGFGKNKIYESFSKSKKPFWIDKKNKFKKQETKKQEPEITDALLSKIKTILDRYPTPPNPLTDENFLRKVKQMESAEKEKGHRELLATQRAALMRLKNEDIASNNYRRRSYVPELRRLLDRVPSQGSHDGDRSKTREKKDNVFLGKKWQHGKENRTGHEKGVYRESGKKGNKYWDGKYGKKGNDYGWQKKQNKYWGSKYKSTEVFKDSKKGDTQGFETGDKKSYWTLHALSNALDIKDRFTITHVYERIKIFFFILYRYGLEKLKIPAKLRRSPMYAYMNDPVARLQWLFRKSTEIFFKKHPFLDRNYQMKKMLATQKTKKKASGELLFFRYVRNTVFINFQNFLGFNTGKVVDRSFLKKSYQYFGLVFLYYYAYWGRKRAQGYSTRFRSFGVGKKRKKRVYVKTYNESIRNRRNFFKFFYQYFFFFSDVLNLRHKFSLYRMVIYLFYKILIRVILAIGKVKWRIQKWKKLKRKKYLKNKGKGEKLNRNRKKSGKTTDKRKNDGGKNNPVGFVVNNRTKNAGSFIRGGSFGFRNVNKRHGLSKVDNKGSVFLSGKRKGRNFFGSDKKRKIAGFIAKHMRYHKREVGTLVKSRYRYKDIPEMMHKNYVVKSPPFLENSFGFIIRWKEGLEQDQKEEAIRVERSNIKREFIQENILAKYSRNGKMGSNFFFFRLFFAYLKKSSDVFYKLQLKSLVYSRKLNVAFQLRLFRWFLRVYKRNFGARIYKIFVLKLQRLIKFKLNKLLSKGGAFVSNVVINPISSRSVTVEVLLSYYKYKMRRKFNFKSVTYFFIRRFRKSARRNYIRGFFAEGAGRFTKKQRAAFIKVMYGKARFSTISELLRFGYTNYVTEHGTCGISLWLNYWGVKVGFRASCKAVFNVFKFKVYS